MPARRRPPWSCTWLRSWCTWIAPRTKTSCRYRTRFFPGDIYSDIPDRVGGIYWSTWGVVDSKTGVYGDPTAATAETGKALFDEIVCTYRDFLREFYTHNA